MPKQRTKYPIFLDKKYDALIVEALKHLQITADKEKSKRIKTLLHGMAINRPHEWSKDATKSV